MYNEQCTPRAVQGGRGCLAFVQHSKIPQNFRRASICKFVRQEHCFLRLRENRQFVVVKGLKHTQTRFLKHPFRCLDMYFFLQSFYFTKDLWKLYESSPKAGPTKVLWKLYESSPKAGSPKALRKQVDFFWKPFKSKLTFIENTPKLWAKVGWLS